MDDRVTAQKQRVTITWEDDPLQIITFDATVSEGHKTNAEITDHPVEDGADITDHIRSLPDELTLTATITDTPLLKNGATEAEPANTGGEVNRRAVSAYEFLLKTKDQGKLLTVFTKLRTYTGMAMDSMSITRDKDTSRQINTQISLREVLIAVTEQVKAPVPAVTAAPSRRGKGRRGKKNKKKENEANKGKSRRKSLAAKGVDSDIASDIASGIAGLFGG